ncbi:MAG: preprotein translocase subunit SecG [Nitrospinae bacterium]|nr:preprotein translocase subunit SecG [Nitrospinota bacterium]
METFITVLHVFIALAIIGVILLQEGKAGMGVSFGGGSNSSVFGSSGAGNFLVKVTVVLAIIFAVTSVTLSIYGPNQNISSVMERVKSTPTPIKSVVAAKNADKEASDAKAEATKEIAKSKEVVEQTSEKSEKKE